MMEIKREKGRPNDNEAVIPHDLDLLRVESMRVHHQLDQLNKGLLERGSMTTFEAERAKDLMEESNRLLASSNSLIVATAKKIMGLKMVGPDAKIFEGTDIGQVPYLPCSLLKILRSRCELANDGRTVAETHRLILLPCTINALPLTLSSLSKFAFEIGISGSTGNSSYHNEAFGNAKLERSVWVLEYEDVAPGTLGKSDSEQILVVDKLSHYRTARVLEHVGTMVLQYLENGERIYSNCFGHCEEMSASGDRVYSGVFAGNGLSVLNYSEPHRYLDLGRAIVRKLNI